MATMPTAKKKFAIGDQCASTSETALDSSCPGEWPRCQSSEKRWYFRVTARRVRCWDAYCTRPVATPRITMVIQRMVEMPSTAAMVIHIAEMIGLPASSDGMMKWSVA